MSPSMRSTVGVVTVAALRAAGENRASVIAAHLENAFLDGTTLTDADLTGARLDDATIDGADFTLADLTV